jgi:hypothetical protein
MNINSKGFCAYIRSALSKVSRSKGRKGNWSGTRSGSGSRRIITLSRSYSLGRSFLNGSYSVSRGGSRRT